MLQWRFQGNQAEYANVKHVLAQSRQKLIELERDSEAGRKLFRQNLDTVRAKYSNSRPASSLSAMVSMLTSMPESEPQLANMNVQNLRNWFHHEGQELPTGCSSVEAAEIIYEYFAKVERRKLPEYPF